jgi:hypothetical protein
MPSTTRLEAREGRASAAGLARGRAPSGVVSPGRVSLGVVSPGGGRSGSVRRRTCFPAGVAQLVERQPSKLNVASSSLVSRSVLFGFGRPNPKHFRTLGLSRGREVLGQDDSMGLSRGRGVFGRPNQETLALSRGREVFGVIRSCAVDAARARSYSAHLAQLVEHVLGKDEVTSSILVVGSKRLVRSLMALDPNASSPAPGRGRARAFRFAVAAA